MELHSAARLTPEAPLAGSPGYLDRLPLAAAVRQQLAARLARLREPSTQIEALHSALAETPVDPENPALASIHRRLELAYGAASAGARPFVHDANQRVRLLTALPITRTPMAPDPWPPSDSRRSFRWLRSALRQRAAGAGARSAWQRVAAVRRVIALALVIGQTVLATGQMASVLPYHGQQVLEVAILALFATLVAWVSVGFWTAVAGFALQLKGGDRYAIAAAEDADIPVDARTAVIMPICNEDVTRLFAGLRATYESVAAAGALHRFDFFVLSDSNDADARVGEIAAWHELCRSVNGFGRVFYRWRRHRIKRKSGNVADFCRRWGADYRYMVVLDADSVMSGDCLVRLVKLMEANPGAGIIQTAPSAAGRDSLFARVQQFANRIYGPLFVAGLHFWQLGESHYWGHNAIIRIAPFIRHCALGRLPGSGPLSGEILSHDFVEAALMRRAGWDVWLAYDLPGSYEEMPPNLVDELTRDRRWCQGNLMNFRFLFASGLHPAHRAVFVTGAAAYVSALLWFLFLLLSTAQLAIHVLRVPDYFLQPFQLFPVWPEWHPLRAITLFAGTALLLFLPKLLAVSLVCLRDPQRFGGRLRLVLGMLAELVFSTLLAPIRMLFHTQFVLAALLGRSVAWKSPPRDDSETGWVEACRRHGWHSLLGLAWAGGVYWLNPTYLWWLMPIVGALTLSIPISVYSSRVAAGRRLRAARLFLIPEETEPPEVLRRTWEQLKRAPRPPAFVDAVLDPVINALCCAAAPTRTRSPLARRRQQAALEEALRGGPDALSSSSKMSLLNDPVALSRLHSLTWSADDIHPAWREARRGGSTHATT